MNIIRLYNQNRKMVWCVILIIASLFGILQLANYYTKKSNEEKLANATNSSSTTNTINEGNNVNTLNVTTSKAITNVSGVQGKTITEEELTNVQNLFDEFFEYCNNKELKSAYDMLTDECKELIYPSLTIFTENYYNNIFGDTTKIYSFENWNNDTYIVTIEDDILATGKATSEEDKKVDYITIVDDKLNISTYIGRKNINKETTKNDITIKVNSKDIYMDYETYNVSITNNTESTICITDINDTKGIYLLDDNDIKYGIYNHELVESNMILKTNYSVTLSLKFYSSYVASKDIEYIVFDNIFLDYENTQDNIYSLSAEV